MKPTLWIFIFCVAAFLSACGGSGEGKLVVYSAGPRPLAEKICRSFEENTGVKVELFSATTGQIMAKVEAEKYNPRADVLLIAAETPMVGLKLAGRLHHYRPAGLEYPKPGWSDPEGYYHATGAAAVGIAFRRGETDPTSTWRGVLAEGLQNGRGRVAMPSPSRSGTAGDFLLALRDLLGEGFWDLFKNARHRGFEIVGANSQAVTGLSIGAYDAVYCAADYIICREIAKGESLEIHFPPEGCLYVFRPVAILASSRRIPDAERFVDHCFTRDAQEKIAADHLIPALRDLPLSTVRRRFAVPESLPFDPIAALQNQKQVIRRFQYEIERAVIKP